MDKVFVGVDVAKETLDIAIAGEATALQIANEPCAIRAWLEQARSLPLALVAFEPTGGYERALRRALLEAGVVYAIVHPNAVVAFRKVRGIKAKTDKIDAKLLAAFARDELARRDPTPPAEPDEALRELVARRRQLVDTLQAERCRLRMVDTASVRASIGLMITMAASSIDAIELEIETHIAASELLRTKAAMLRTLKGVGVVTAATLLAFLPELGRLGGKQIAALVGLAPRNRESGKWRGHASIGHGRGGVVDVLFNVARCAIRHNRPLKAFYERLVQDNGRPGKVALVAVMRKIIVILNAIARDNRPWNHATA